VHGMLFEGLSPSHAIRDLMQRGRKAERIA
jgi:hypothetical protein